MNDNTQQIQKLEEENQKLRRSIEELSILNEVATAISSTTSLDRIIDLIVHKCVKHLKVEQGAIHLLDRIEESNDFKTMVRRVELTSNFVPYRPDTQLTGWMLQNKSTLMVNDLKNDKRFTISENPDFNISSVLAAPLLLKGKMIGTVCLFNKKEGGVFVSEDQKLLSIIAAQSAQIIENARLYEEEQDLLCIQEEMRLAYDIQANLLPATAPVMEDYDIVGRSIPAKEVGGDYFDFIAMEDGRIAICLGDVSGKGVPAALLMSNLQATLRGQTMLQTLPAQCINRANVLLHRSTDLDKYVTLFYGQLDPKNHQLIYTNAGHDDPLFLHNGSLIKMKKGGIVLGFMEYFKYEEGIQTIRPGDILVLYTDGITEAMNANEEEFGDQRLIDLLKQHQQLSAGQILNKIIDAAIKHAGDHPQSDDMTIIVLKRN